MDGCRREGKGDGEATVPLSSVVPMQKPKGRIKQSLTQTHLCKAIRLFPEVTLMQGPSVLSTPALLGVLSLSPS